MKRKTKKKKRALTRSLVLLVDRFSNELDRLEAHYRIARTKDQYSRRAKAKKIHDQQHNYFQRREKPKNRIVSLDKDYIRPIVRGKETKAVEFGAKVNKFQIDGISFIEHLSFETFHEGNRFQDTVLKAQRLSKTKLAGADAIHATNKTRGFASRFTIRTDFKRIGRAGEHEKQREQLAMAITKERACQLKGSFGTEKEHYYLKKIKARTRRQRSFGYSSASTPPMPLLLEDALSRFQRNRQLRDKT